MSFPRYTSYKESSVEWVDEIPGNWTPTRLRFLLKDGYEGLKIGPFGSQLTSEMLEEEGAYKVYGQENVIANDFARGSRYIGQVKFGELTVYEITPGDILITMMGTSGRCDVAPADMTPGIMDSHLLRMRVTTSVRPKFVRLLIDEAAYVGTQIQLAGKGSIMHGLNSSIVKNLVLFVPPDDEQVAILSFLDRETAKIDGLVAEQRRLMELLKEKRQAVISHAVTRGLNPKAPLKSSDIEWLGDVPAHWEVMRLKFVLENVKAGPFGSALTKDEYVSAGYRVYGQEQVIPNDFTIGDYFITHKKFDELSQYSVSAGDILISCVGTFGKIAIVPNNIEPGIINPRLIRLRCSSAANSLYLVEVLRSAVTFEQLACVTRGGTMDVINIGTLSAIVLVLPPLVEQAQLLAFIHRETAKFDTLTAEAQRAIDLLQERRTALISAAVTGQIDVRHT